MPDSPTPAGAAPRDEAREALVRIEAIAAECEGRDLDNDAILSIARKALAATPQADPEERLLESKQSDDWQTIKAECDRWWIAAIADEAPFVVTRIRKRVEAYAAARAPGGTAE